jgi:hypothetical protein
MSLIPAMAIDGLYEDIWKKKLSVEYLIAESKSKKKKKKKKKKKGKLVIL